MQFCARLSMTLVALVRLEPSRVWHKIAIQPTSSPAQHSTLGFWNQLSPEPRLLGSANLAFGKSRTKPRTPNRCGFGSGGVIRFGSMCGSIPPEEGSVRLRFGAVRCSVGSAGLRHTSVRVRFDYLLCRRALKGVDKVRDMC